MPDDRSPFPGRCSSGRACASDCRDLDSQLSRIFPDADASLTSSCSELIGHQPGNCWSSWNDGKREEEATDPDIRLVQALCPESCRSCSSAAIRGLSVGGRSHATVAAAELARRTELVPATPQCTVEQGVVYEDVAGYLFKWRAVLNADICASLCSSSTDCLAFTFYAADHAEFSKFDCVLHNSTAATSGRRSNSCCISGQACAARCRNQNLYVPASSQEAL